MEEIVRVGVGVMIIKDGKYVLLGRRKGSHGAGEWGMPGGHLEHGETIMETALREIKEECGVRVKNLRVLCVSDLLKYLPKHYIDVGVVCEWDGGEPQVLEPEKLESWQWLPLDKLPKNLFACDKEYIIAYKTGQNYFTVK